MEREEVIEEILHTLGGYNTTPEILTRNTLIRAFGNQSGLESFLNSISNLPTDFRELHYDQKPSCLGENGEIKKSMKSNLYKKEIGPFLGQLANLNLMDLFNMPAVLLDTLANYCLDKVPHEFREPR